MNASTDTRHQSWWFRYRWVKHKCWHQTSVANEIGGFCKGFAWLEVWGWRWCLYHWLQKDLHHYRHTKIVL